MVKYTVLLSSLELHSKYPLVVWYGDLTIKMVVEWVYFTGYTALIWSKGRCRGNSMKTRNLMDSNGRFMGTGTEWLTTNQLYLIPSPFILDTHAYLPETLTGIVPFSKFFHFSGLIGDIWCEDGITVLFISVALLRVCSVFFLRVLLELLGVLKRLGFRCVDGYAGRSISGLWVKSRTFAQKAPIQSVVVVVAPKLR